MPAVTYLSDHQVKNSQAVIGDKEFNDLFQEFRNITGENWLIDHYEHPVYRRAWLGLWHSIAGYVKVFTLYADCHGEWQVMNLVTPEGGSNFNVWRHSREAIMNYMLGYIAACSHPAPK